MQGNSFPSQNGNLLNSLCANSWVMVGYSTGKPGQVFHWLETCQVWSIFSFPFTWAVVVFCEQFSICRGMLLALMGLRHLLWSMMEGENGMQKLWGRMGPRFLQKPVKPQLQRLMSKQDLIKGNWIEYLLISFFAFSPSHLTTHNNWQNTQTWGKPELWLFGGGWF